MLRAKLLALVDSIVDRMFQSGEIEPGLLPLIAGRHGDDCRPRRSSTIERDAAPMISREFELAAIEDYLRDPGPTICPSAFAVPVDALSTTELARRMAAFAPRARTPTKEEARRRWRELLHLSATAPDVDRSYQLWLTRLPVRL